MHINAKKYEIEGGPFYLLRKHYCPLCSELLTRKRNEVIVNSKSKEAENYDFTGFKMLLMGNVMFITFYYECEKCSKEYSIDELMEEERKIRIKKRHLKREVRKKKNKN